MFKKKLTQTHVTALEIIEPDYILEGKTICLHLVAHINWFFKFTGSGGILSLYDLTSNTLLEDVDLFRGSRIHSIQKSDSSSDLIVFGGKHLAVIGISSLSTSDRYFFRYFGKHLKMTHCLFFRKLIVRKRLEEADWIQDAKLVDGGKNLVLLTSHNKVINYELLSGIVIEEFQCTEQCIL